MKHLMRWIFFVSLAVLMTACGESGEVADFRLEVDHPEAGSVGQPLLFEVERARGAQLDDVQLEWTLQRPDKSQAELERADSETRRRLIPDYPGGYVVTVVGVDRDRTSAAFEARVTVVGEPNQPPTADAGSGGTGSTGQRVTLDGSASSDPDGDELSYKWQFRTRPSGSTARIAQPGTTEPYFIPDLAGQYIAELRVSDGVAFDTDTAVFQIGESATPQPPIANAGPDRDIAIGKRVVLDGTGSRDPNNDDLTFAWSFIDKPIDSQAVLSLVDAPTPDFTADVAGDYTVELVVSDGILEDSDEVTITAIEAQESPRADAGSDRTVQPRYPVLLDGTGSVDPNGEALTYEWTMRRAPAEADVEISDADQPMASFTPAVPGEYAFQLKVVDESGLGSSDEVVVTAAYIGSPPQVDLGAPQTTLVDAAMKLRGAVSDAEDDLADLDIEWSLANHPSLGADNIESPDTLEAVLRPSALGEYIVALDVTDRDGNIVRDDISIRARALGRQACLIISEYVEGSGANRAVELYNCGTESLNLSPVRLCLEAGDNDVASGQSCDGAEAFEGVLPAGEVLVACHSQADGVPGAACDIVSPAVDFDGDDRFVIYADDGDQSFDVGNDTIIDAFGELGLRPANQPWADKTLRRCGFERFDGQSTFSYSALYEEAFADTFDDLGVAPVEGCTQ